MIGQRIRRNTFVKKEKKLEGEEEREEEDGDTKEEQNKRLLNALRLRGNKSYKRFRELMYRTGNFLVADLLWDKEEGPGRMVIDEADLASKFSAVLNCLHDSQRTKFLRYLDAKIREKALLLSWREGPGERMESLSARVVDFNQERGLRDTIAGQEMKIKDLEGQLKTEGEKKNALRLDLSTLQQQMKALRQDHLVQLATQSRFHDVNMLTITRLKNEVSWCKGKAESLNSQITTTLGGGGGGRGAEKRKTTAGAEEEEKEEEEDGEEKTEKLFCELETKVHSLLQQYIHEKVCDCLCYVGQARKGRSQREEVLAMLNRAGHAKDSLVGVVRDVLKHEQKHRALVMRDIQRLSDTLKQVVPSSTLAPPTPLGVTPTEMALHPPPLDPATLDTKHFKSQLSLLKAEAEHIQKRFQWKDSEAAKLRHQLLALKQRFHDYTLIAATHTPPPHTLCPSCRRASQGASLSGEGWGAESRRSSVGGRWDLDQTVVDVEEYLLGEDAHEVPPNVPSPNPTPDTATLGPSEGHATDASPRPSSSVKEAGETKSADTQTKGDAKSNSVCRKARVKRKLMSK
ncbi:hypothetical protein ACOMHN_058838 [Nucella lapillus]